MDGQILEMENAVQENLDVILELLSIYGLRVVGAIVILIVGWTVAGWGRRLVLRSTAKIQTMDETVARFLASLVRYGIIAFTVLAVLSQFGVETASFIAVLATMGLAVGLALQGTLGHVASGFMLLIFRPFKIGDFVEAGGVAGTVKDINLFTTELATGDNVQILIPNGQIWGSAIRNFSFNDTRRVDFGLGIGYEDDINKAFSAIRSVIEGESRAYKDPEPLIVVGELADSSVNLTIRIWVDASDYWGVRFDLNKAFKERLDQEGINIPYPQQVVHMVSDGPAAA